MSVLGPLGHDALAAYTQLLTEERIECEYARDGLLDVCHTEDGFAGARHEAELVEEYGYAPSVLRDDKGFVLTGRDVRGLFVPTGVWGVVVQRSHKLRTWFRDSELRSRSPHGDDQPSRIGSDTNDTQPLAAEQADTPALTLQAGIMSVVCVVLVLVGGGMVAAAFLIESPSERTFWKLIAWGAPFAFAGVAAFSANQLLARKRSHPKTTSLRQSFYVLAIDLGEAFAMARLTDRPRRVGLGQ